MIDIYDEYKDLPLKIIENVKKEVAKRKVTNKQLIAILDRIRKEYEYAQINPGEAIGIITAESFGEPSTQMSISKNEKIIIKINKKIRIIEIGKFIDMMMEKNGSYNLKDTDFLSLNNFEIFVPSLNEEEKIEWKRIIECSRHKYKKRLMKLITASGREILATNNHSFVIRKNNKVVPIQGLELKVDDRIPVINYLPENCITKISINKYIQIPSDKEIRRFHIKLLPDIIKLDSSFGWFIGAYLADGNVSSGQLSISNINDAYINNAKEFIETIGLDYKEKYHARGFALSRDLIINSSLLARFILTCCRTGSRFKQVPDFAYSAKKEFVSALLKGYFDGDANFHVKRKMIRVSSNSKELRDGIALLLSRFKIFSYKITDKKGQYWLLIPYKYAPLYLQFIGSDIEHKKIALKNLAELAKKFWNKSNDYIDMISGFNDLFYKVAKKLGMRTRYINNFTKRQTIGRTTLFRYIKKFEILSKRKNIDIKKDLAIMRRMFYSDVVWDAIKKIEYTDYKDKYVYDLTVHGLETFTTFQGVITHNTLNVKHFAGVAEMNITMGLPRLIEIFDARKEPSTPVMDIYLKKDYTKDIAKIKKIAAQIKETLFKDIVTEFSIDMSKMYVKATLDKDKLKEFGIGQKTLVKTLSSSIKNVTIRLNKNNEIIFKGKEQNINEVYALKEKVKNIFIKGVKGVGYVLPFRRGGEFIVSSAGTNLKDVLKIEEVDETRTLSNDIFEICKLFGIEAARQAIINEAIKVIENQGLDIDIRHILFIADAMTTTGRIKGITRTGITGEKESVLARASFETPIRHLINASLTGEEDKLNSVIENVILNQPIPVGTGLPNLVAKMREKKDEWVTRSPKK